MNIKPFETRYDVAVLGGGMCGIGAAFTLAEKGKKVLLVERRPFLVWEVNGAFYCKYSKSESPVARRIYRRINAINGMRGERLEPPLFEVLLDKMAEEENIDLLLFSEPTQLIWEGNLVKGVVVGNKSGEQIIYADVFIDATEEALLWKQTDLSWSKDKVYSCIQTVFFNFTEDIFNLPINLGDLEELKNITLYPANRDKEVCVEFVMPEYSIAESRLAMDRVVRFAKEKVSQLKNSIVSHAGLEPYPIDVKSTLTDSTLKHPKLVNLFGAGIWTISNECERLNANTLAGRIELGEQVGAMVYELKTTSEGALSKLDIPEMDLPQREADVIVAGGGTAGALAAIAAGRQGAEVILLEASTILGGMITGGGVNFLGHGVRGGLQDEFHKRAGEMKELYCGIYSTAPVHVEAAKVVLEQMCIEAGVQVVYGATAIGAIMEGNRIKGIIAATPQGKMAFKAKAIVDSTGDADVAAMAGAPTYIGREVDGVIHCYSKCAQLIYPNGKVHPTNHDAGYCDTFDVVDLTRARRDGIRQMYDRWWRGLQGEKQLLTMCPILGIRQGRMIVGDYMKDMIEQIQPVHYEDCIGYEAAKYDCHSQDFENQQDLPVLWVWLLGNRERGIGGETPYRSMLPKDVEGLLVACRSVSSTNEANYEIRVIRNMYRIGEAAGIAAAFCAKLDTTPRALDVKLVQAELHKSGALGDQVRPKQVVPNIPFEELKDLLASHNPKDAVWNLAMGGEKEIALLKDVVKNGPENARFWAAVALAWHKSEEALNELIEWVEERKGSHPNYTPVSRNMIPLWQSVIVMLGRIGSKKAIPVLVDVLNDPTINMDVMIAAVRALGRIGDLSVVPLLENILLRKDLPRKRLYQCTNIDGRWPAGEDGLWQVELAITEVLAGLGKPKLSIIEKYLSDERKHVRRYAYYLKLGMG